MRKMIRIVVLFVMLVGVTQYATAQQAVSQKQDEPVGKPFEVHGRLGVYNGTPSCRVWIVGTKRILGIHEAETECPIPSDLRRILEEDINDRWIYADVIVLPLTKRLEGAMQIVRLEGAKNIVVTTGDGRFLKRINGVIGRKTPEPGGAPDRQETAPASR